jgi:hypothetical protein
MPPINHQENFRGKLSGSRLLVKPMAAPAILLWMQNEGHERLPFNETVHAKGGHRAAIIVAAVLCGGLALACVLAPGKDAGVPEALSKTHSIQDREVEERQMLRLSRSSAKAFDRDGDLAKGWSDIPPITILREPLFDAALSSLKPVVEEAAQPPSEPILSQPRFSQEFWRTIDQSRLSDAYASYLGRYSSKIAEERRNIDFVALGWIDEEEMKRLDARRAEVRLHVGSLEVPIPRRAPRALQIKKPASARTARTGCRNRIWQCPPSIPPVAQGNVPKLRSRAN